MTARSSIVGGVALGLVVVVQAPDRAVASTILLSAESFAVLGASTVTNTGATTINGDVGVYPGTAITGEGTITLTGGTYHSHDAVAQQAQLDETSAYNILFNLPATSDYTTLHPDLGGLTLTPGVYKYDTSAQLTGALTLNFEGKSNQEIVVQIGTTLTTASASSVKVEGANSTDGVFFQVGSSATLGSTTVFAGNILALDTIALDSGAEILCGRALAQTAEVTMIGNTITDECPGNGIGNDAGSFGYSGGDFTNVSYPNNGAFNGVPPTETVASVPEPSTLALFGGGFVGFLGLAMRRRRVRLA